MQIINPNILTLITTYMCTSSCKNCCFDCSPRPQKKMNYSEIKLYIEKSIDAFPSLKTVVFTGGECTLLKEDLFNAINLCTNLGLSSRIITNGHWAKTKNQTSSYIEKLTKAGLKEINFSTGSEHQKFVPVNNIINGVDYSCLSESINAVVVNIESCNEKKYYEQDFMSKINSSNLDAKRKKKLLVLNSPWMKFKKRSYEHVNIKNKIKAVKSKGCKNLFNGIYINPNAQLLSCCGLACEYIPFLKIGRFIENKVKIIYSAQFNDFLKIWLFTEGPLKILHTINGAGKIEKGLHDCDYCLQLLSSKSNIEKLLNINKKKIKEIIMRYNLRITL